MHRVWPLARVYGLDALIVLAAIMSALTVVFEDDPERAPRLTAWVAAPGIALVALPLLARRRFPFAAPAAVWLLAASLSFADGRLVALSPGTFVVGLVAAFLLGRVPDGPARGSASCSSSPRRRSSPSTTPERPAATSSSRRCCSPSRGSAASRCASARRRPRRRRRAPSSPSASGRSRRESRSPRSAAAARVASWRRATPSGGASSATCTTGRSPASWRSP